MKAVILIIVVASMNAFASNIAEKESLDIDFNKKIYSIENTEKNIFSEIEVKDSKDIIDFYKNEDQWDADEVVVK